ncbi:MAG: ABC transporter ATP-binding protein [Deltaproteobacteria bacterium]|nr:MAG: ABC transporter ATP-binding protein [Deltaproteobacteria bacterium]
MGLSHAYGDQPVIDHLSLSIQKGDFFIVIGPNGSGKTTLLKIISGLLKLQQGDLMILDRSLQSYTRKALAKKIAYVPQMASLDFPFTVMELVLMGRSPHLGPLGLGQEKDVEMAKKAMAFTGVEHLSGRKLEELSGGEQQRVFIARAICQAPEVILLDEPTASLDLAHQVRIMDMMERLKKERNVTIVMVSHDVNLAAMYGERLLLLKQGRIVSMGSPEEVLTYQALETAYGCTLLVDQSPIGEYPRVTLVPQKHMLADKQPADRSRLK